MFRIATVVFSLLVVPFLVSPLRGEEASEAIDNWPQWRGPEANGVAPTWQPARELGRKDQYQMEGRNPGHGVSTPIVWGKQIFLLTAIGTGRAADGAAKAEDQPERPFGIKFPNTYQRHVVLCLDRDTGKTLWERTATEDLPPEGHHGDSSFASASPTTNGRLLYASFGSCGLYCFDLGGEIRWKAPLAAVQTRLSFGEACSPVLHGQSLILNRDNDGRSQLLVFDAETGDLRWKADRDEISAWATPLAVDYNGRTQIITNASKRVRSYDLETGAVIWECGGQVGNVIPAPRSSWQPGVLHEWLQRKYRHGVSVGCHRRHYRQQKIAWQYPRDTPYVPSPLLYGDALYFTKSNSAILTSVNVRTGEPITATRLPELNNIYASPAGAAGRVYLVGREGTTLVIKHGDETETLATNRLDDSIDASPAIAGRQLLLRGRKFLYASRGRPCQIEGVAVLLSDFA